MLRGLTALSCGALSLGITKFAGMVLLLPFIAAYFKVSTAQTGPIISACASGAVR